MNWRIVEFPKPELLARLALNESGFVFDPVTGNSYTVNESGLAIMRHLKNSEGLDRIIETLQDKFSVDTQIAERDVIEFAASLRIALK